MYIPDITNKLVEKKLKASPKSVAILEAIIALNNHPTAENRINFTRQNQPNIATATVYKVFEISVENNLIKKVKTDRDLMRYDAIMKNTTTYIVQKQIALKITLMIN